MDAGYYITLLIAGDALHERALQIGAQLRTDRLVTSEPVFVELLAHVSRMGEVARAEAVGIIDDLRLDPRLTIVPQTPELFEDGLSLFRHRLDKGYSLTDCMSMSICRRLDIKDVLTHDRHFAQEGFATLI